MQNLDNKIELLAPVGDIDSLRQAVYCGADAVYFGYKNFNARRKADNFENLKEVTDFCHLYNVKAYLALNTTLKHGELSAVEEIIKESVEAKIDAYIICDLSLVDIIKKYNKNPNLHASTQMGIHNYYGAKFLKDLGFTRIVLSRETSAKDIEEIKSQIDIELEYFIQGALCVSFSGGCLMSSMLGGNSGNRGLCSQLCRHIYSYKGREGYFLSPKDLCLAKKLKDLYKLGIESFKIEGRMRRYEYVANSVSIYRDIIDNNFNVSEKHIDNLKRLYNRGDFTEGYIFDKENIIYDRLNGHKGIFFAKVVKINRERIFIKADKKINQGDGFKILRNQTEVGSAIGKDVMSDKGYWLLKYNGNVNIGDEVYITTDAEYNLNVIKHLKLPIDIDVVIKHNQEITVNAINKDIVVTVKGIIPDIATNNPTNKDTVVKQFKKVGETEFAINNLNIELDDGIFISIGELNNLRRQVLEKLKSEIIAKYEIQNFSLLVDSTKHQSQKKNLEKDSSTNLEEDISIIIDKDYSAIKEEDYSTTNKLTNENNNYDKNFKINKTERKISDSKIYIRINNVEEIDLLNLTKISELKPTIIINPVIYNTLQPKSILNYKEKYNNSKFYLNLPIFANFADLNLLEKYIPYFDGVFAENYYGIELAEKYQKELILGFSINIFNKSNPLIKYSNMFVSSVELSKNELKEFNNSKMLIYAYGNLPLMNIKVCYNKIFNMAKCEYCNKDYALYIEDRKNKYLVKNQNICDCTHILYNPIKTDIGTDNNYTYFLDLSIDKEYNVVKDYAEKKRVSDKLHTKNHLNRGVN